MEKQLGTLLVIDLIDQKEDKISERSFHAKRGNFIKWSIVTNCTKNILHQIKRLIEMTKSR